MDWRTYSRFILQLAIVASLIGCGSNEIQTTDGSFWNWKSYASDKASSKYSPLSQINEENFTDLTIAWKWESPDQEILADNSDLHTWVWESTPLVIDGVLYTSTYMSQVAAIDAVTGETLWIYNPESWKNGIPSNAGFAHRGVEYGKVEMTRESS